MGGRVRSGRQPAAGKIPLEIEYTRKAARACRSGMSACIDVIRDGATDYEIAAEYMRVSTLEGSEPTGFGPFIRPTTRLGESIPPGAAKPSEMAMRCFWKMQHPPQISGSHGPTGVCWQRAGRGLRNRQSWPWTA